MRFIYVLCPNLVPSTDNVLISISTLLKSFSPILKDKIGKCIEFVESFSQLYKDTDSVPQVTKFITRLQMRLADLGIMNFMVVVTLECSHIHC